MSYNQLHKCYVCDQDYFQYELEVHFVIHHSKYFNQDQVSHENSEQLYKCQDCKKLFASKSELDTHVDGKLCYKCAQCNRKFFSAFNLKRHNKLKHYSRIIFEK